MSRFSSLHLRFLVLILVVLLPIVFLLVYTNLQTQQLAESTSTADVLRLANVAAQGLTRSIGTTEQFLTAVGQMEQVRERDTAVCNTRLVDLLRRHPQFAVVSVIQPNGAVICRAPAFPSAANMGDREWFRDALLNSGRTVAHYEIDPLVGIPVVVVARDVIDPSGQVMAVIAADVIIDSLDKYLPPTYLPAGSDVLLVDHHGTILSRYPQPGTLTGRLLPDVGIIKTILASTRQGTIAMPGEDGVPRLYAWTPLEGHSPTAYLAVGIPATVAFAVADDMTARNLSLFAAAVILAFLAAWVASDFVIVRQAGALLSATERLGSGDLSARIRLKYRLGGAPLVAAFNDMAHSLEDHVRALRESEERYRRIVETATEGIWIVDDDGKTEYVNGRAAEMLAYAPDEMMQRTPIDMLFPQDAGGAGAELARKLKGAGGEGTFRMRRQDGRKIWVKAAITPFRDEQGTYKGALVMFHDVTESRRAQAQIQNLNITLERRVRERTAELYHRETALRLANVAAEQERNRLRTLIESLPDQVWFADADGNIVLMNPSTAVQTDDEGTVQASAFMLPEEWETLTPDGRPRPPEDSPFYRCLHGEPVFVEELVRHRKTGQWRYRQINATPLRGRTGRIIGAVAIIRDMTEHKRAENMISQLNQDMARRAADLEIANQELEAFSYSVSHDLRAPLASINGFSRLLLQDYENELPPRVVSYVQLIQENSLAMAQLIEDLLHFSRATRSPLNKQTVEPAKLIREVLEDLRSAQIGRKIELTVGELPPCNADPVLLKQVFANLLSNALKFTRRREVAHIEVGHQAAGEGTAGNVPSQGGVESEASSVVYYVRDNGVGFDMKTADNLFRVFRRLHSEEEYEGTGVGLAIVERIIRRHGGRVWAEAEVEKGATFYFTL